MRVLKELEFKNIELFELGEISKSELMLRVPSFNKEDFLRILSNLKNSKDRSDLFETIFWHTPTSINKEESEGIFSLFLVENWHNEHEEIVSSFQQVYNNNKLNIKPLILALKSPPEYLEHDDFKYPYIRKIIYAIGAQPEQYNIEALEVLVKETNDSQIKELALHQIKKRKELGRWEFNANTESES